MPTNFQISDSSSFFFSFSGNRIRSYSFGFNGQLKDSEVYGEGNCYSFEYRILDPRIGRFMSTDPLGGIFAWNSSYSFAENSPMAYTDLEGAESKWAAKGVADAVNWLMDKGEVDQGVQNGVNTCLGILKSTTAAADGGSFVFEKLQGAQSALQGGALLVTGEGDINDALNIARTNDAFVLVENTIDQVDRIAEGGEDGYMAAGEIIGEVATIFIGVKGIKGPKNTWKGPVDYTVLPEAKNVAPGKPFGPAQLKAAKSLNMKENGGSLKSDIDGSPINKSKQAKKGVPADMNQVEGDHITAKSNGGTNSNANLRLISKSQNLKKSNK